jgi:hypothetical protein
MTVVLVRMANKAGRDLKGFKVLRVVLVQPVVKGSWDRPAYPVKTGLTESRGQ